MAVRRSRWALLLAVLAMGMQLLAASGLAMATTSAHCGMQSHAMGASDGGCPDCAKHSGHGSTSDCASSACTLACAAAGAASVVRPFAAPRAGCRDVVPDRVARLTILTRSDDLLRPPTNAA